MFRKKSLVSELEKMFINILEKEIANIEIKLKLFNKELMIYKTLSPYPFSSLFTSPWPKDPIVFYEYNINLNNHSFVRSLYEDKKPIYDFYFHDSFLPKDDECIYKSEQNGTQLLKVKNGIVSIPPELLTKNFSISYITAGGRTLGKTFSSSFRPSPKIINPMLD